MFRTSIANRVRRLIPRNPSRYVLGGVAVQNSDEEGVAFTQMTDGRLALCEFIPSSGQVDKPTVVPVSKSTKKRGSMPVTVNGHLEVEGVEATPIEQTIPPIPEVYPEVSEDSHHCVTLNVELLSNLVTAMGRSGAGPEAVTLMVSDNPKKPIALFSRGNREGEYGTSIGALMPINSDFHVEEYEEARQRALKVVK